MVPRRISVACSSFALNAGWDFYPLVCKLHLLAPSPHEAWQPSPFFVLLMILYKTRMLPFGQTPSLHFCFPTGIRFLWIFPSVINLSNWCFLVECLRRVLNILIIFCVCVWNYNFPLFTCSLEDPLMLYAFNVASKVLHPLSFGAVVHALCPYKNPPAW